MLHDYIVAIGFSSNGCGNNMILLFYISTTVGFSSNGCYIIMYVTLLYNITISPFTTVNYHLQSILFGCELVRDKT